jgi:hypothetical protein
VISRSQLLTQNAAGHRRRLLKRRIKMIRHKQAWCVFTLAIIGGAAVGAADGSKHNYAFNPAPGNAVFPVAPHPFGSDPGWGGGAKPWQLVDGFRGCNSALGWDCGLAFTGGDSNWGGKPCGVRQATIDLGPSRQISAVRITHHGDRQTPKNYQIQTFNGLQWVVQVNRTNNSVTRCTRPPSYDPAAIATCSITDEFPPVMASKVRYVFNNCPASNTSIVPGTPVVHGWLYEFEALRLPE